MGCKVFSQLAELDYGEICELLELMGIVNSFHSGAWGVCLYSFDSLSERISRSSEAASKAEKSEKE
jgi:hypothetical protein